MKAGRTAKRRTVWAIRGTWRAAAAVFVLGIAASGCGDRERSSPATTKQASPSVVTTTQASPVTTTQASPSTATTKQASPSTATTKQASPSTATTKQASNSTATTKQQATPPTATTKQPSPSPVPQTRTLTAKQIRALVDDSKGKVVVINFWATWCPPCVREFPALIKAYEQYHDKGVNMFAVSMNSPEEKADIEEFLQTHKPPFPVYLKDAQDETFNEAVLKEWFGEMPLTLVFDTDGKRVLAHNAEITFDELSSKLQPLLPPQ